MMYAIMHECGLLSLYAIAWLLCICPRAAGASFGFLQGLAPTIVSELFGLAYFASNYALVCTMFIVSSFSIAHGLMSWNYDMYSNHHTPPTCHGTQCFQTGFYICTALCGLSCVLSSTLTRRRKPFYQLLLKYAFDLSLF
jgi:hypothetical protein